MAAVITAAGIPLESSPRVTTPSRIALVTVSTSSPYPSVVLARLDRRLLYTMRTRFHGKGTETVAQTLAFVGEYGAIWLAIGVALALADPGRRWQWVIAGALGPLAIGLNWEGATRAGAPAACLK